MTASALAPFAVDAELTDIVALVHANHLDQALQRAEALVRREPNHPDVLNLLSHVQRLTGALDEALENINKAVALEPTVASHYITRARVHDALTASGRGNLEDVLSNLNQGIALEPNNDNNYFLRAQVHKLRGEFTLASADFKRTVALNPEHQRARFAWAALSGQEQPAAAPAEYVQNLFDGYAERFENHLLNTLHYRAPEILAKVFAAHAPARPLAILDLGCGTGLAGPHFRPYAHRLDGVDLSPKMLAHAAQKNVYDQLTQADITQHLALHPNTYDVAVAADVLCYLGDLAPTFAALAGCLTAQGQLIFSVEAAATYQDLKLMPSGRYQHSLAYLQRLCTEHGLSLIEHQTETLRTEGGLPLSGHIVLLQKTAHT